MVTSNAYFKIEDETRLILQGEWTVFTIDKIKKEYTALSRELESLKHYNLDATSLELIDTAGAYLIQEKFPDNEITATAEQEKLFQLVPDIHHVPEKSERKNIRHVFVIIGERTTAACIFLYQVMIFIGAVSKKFIGCLIQPKRLRWASVFRHIDETGIRAIPIIGLLGFLMSMVVSYQAAIQLQRFGASIFTIDLTVMSLLREMGVLITAIMVAGRSGSAFTAEIGVMKLREEVDALQTMGMDPIETLVIPRIIALLITLPLLAFFANIIGLAGGAAMAGGLLDIPLGQYIDRVSSVATPTLFFIGMVKAPVFAFLIAVISCFHGLHISGSAENIGRKTTVAVVESIFLVIMVDALFSILFANMGI